MAFGSNITRTRIRSNGTVTKTRKKTTTKSKWGMKGEKTFKPRNGGDSQVSDGGSGLSGDLADVDAGPGTGRRGGGGGGSKKKKCKEGIDCIYFKNHRNDSSYCQHFMEYWHEESEAPIKNTKKKTTSNKSSVFAGTGRTLGETSSSSGRTIGESYASSSLSSSSSSFSSSIRSRNLYSSFNNNNNNNNYNSNDFCRPVGRESGSSSSVPPTSAVIRAAATTTTSTARKQPTTMSSNNNSSSSNNRSSSSSSNLVFDLTGSQ